MTASGSPSCSSGRVSRLPTRRIRTGSSALSQMEMPLSLILARVSGLMKAPPPVASTCGPGGQQAGDHLALAVAEERLAVVGEDLVDGLLGDALDLLVGIDEGQAELGGEALADRRLAAAHQPDHDERAPAQRAAHPLHDLGILRLHASCCEILLQNQSCSGPVRPAQDTPRGAKLKAGSK